MAAWRIDRPGCEHVFRRLGDYLDRELTTAELDLVHAHLDTCAACAQEYRFEASVLEQVKARVRRIAAPKELIDRVIDGIAEQRT